MKRGLMCRSTSVCLSSDEYRSVVVPATKNKYVRLRRDPTITPAAPSFPFHLSSSINNHQHSLSHHLFQVVVMRVSIHCQGCAAKLKKHLSKMQGVTSFSIDIESKRVTVAGHVSPSGVLESISKVKKAEFWPR